MAGRCDVGGNPARPRPPITPTRDDVLDGGDELFFVTTIAAEDGLRRCCHPVPTTAGNPPVTMLPKQPINQLRTTVSTAEVPARQQA